MKNFSISSRLVGTFSLIIAMLAFVAGAAFLKMVVMKDATSDITSNWLPSVEVVNRINTLTSDLRVAEFQHVLNTDDAAMAGLEKNMSKILAALEKDNQTYAKLINSEEEKKRYASFMTDWNQYLKIHEQVLVHSRKNENDQAKALLEGEAKKVFDVSSDLLDKLVEMNHNGAIASADLADASFASAKLTMTVVTAAAILLTVISAYLIIRAITVPLLVARHAAERLASGDLSQKIEVDADNEIGRVLQAMQSMQESLANIVGQVRAGADTIAGASSQIATGNLDLSSRTEEQASSLEETASSMEELTSTVKHNGDNARQANQLAVSAADVATKGGRVVAQVVDTMGMINESSKKIVDIISVIDGIAFQTNILALNAAVEAARAGEQGRGFAVVASEVRNLAQRSASAAKEIKDLISDSVEKVETGSRLVDQAGITMNEVVSSISHVTDIMGELTAAGREQEAGIEQINRAVTEMDTVTQQNAALVEEAAAAAESLKDQAGNLVHLVSTFKLNESHVIAVAAAPVRKSSALATSAAASKNLRALPSAKKPTAVKRATSAPAKEDPAVSGKDDWEEF
ncbi:MCP four helix bundle domain-containing protein [Undibacterium sp. CY18W]|uniref:MCP four helix bundle domain-containing protein n=1 Tax=Undibacterium hunanense TaxID=2762292 RepID=A0ABR6ZWY6_9BURK|nr:methyl-accepting chemotaxis protein [Undibacterium hunanense]MBC3920368.1 MCP four helix bundle domain-containing protein [Undibacterium hunanense]